MDSLGLLAVPIPFGIQAGFIAVTLALYLALAVVLMRVHPRVRPLIRGVTVWIAFTGLVAQSGWLSDFASMPPRIPIIVLGAIGLILWLAVKSPWATALLSIPQSTLIGLQIFRLPVEVLLAALAARGVFATELSWNGSNFDVVVGITAPIMAFWLMRRGEGGQRPLILAWNALGLLLLANVVVPAALSVPYPFQPVRLSIDNVTISRFPVFWLASFLVPMAILLHLLSIRRALRPSS